MKLIITGGRITVKPTPLLTLVETLDVLSGELWVKIVEEDDAFGISQARKQLQFAIQLADKTRKPIKPKQKPNKYMGKLGYKPKIPI